VLENLVMADKMTARGVRVGASYTEKISYVAGYGHAVRDQVLDRAGSKATQDLDAAFRT
jgi:hypothetical protein